MSLYSPFTFFIEATRLLVQKRLKDGQLAFLGDKDGPGARTEVPDAPGYLYARFQNVPDANGNATFSAPFLVRATDAAFQNYPGASVYVSYGYNGELQISEGNFQEMQRNGIDTRTLNPLHQQSKWVYLWQLTIGLCSAVANSVNGSFLVTVKKYRHYVNNVFATFETGAQAAKIDLAPYVPAVDMHCYAAVWVDTYANTAHVTTSTAQSMFTTLDDTDIQECVADRPPDAIPHKLFYLSNAQGTITQQAVKDVDVRQFLNTPAVHGFPNPVAYRERIHPDRQVLFAGSLVVTGSLQVLGSLIAAPTVSGSGGGSSGMTSFIAAGDTGTPQTISDGNTLTIAGGIGIGTTASATDTVTANFDLNTTKGDIAGHNGTNPVRVPVGADGTILVADSADAEGFLWKPKALVQQLRVEPGTSQAPYTTFSGASVSTSICLVPFTGQLITLWNGAGWFDYDSGIGGASAVVYLMSQSITGTRVNGSPIITGLASTTNLIVGMDVSGTGIGVSQKIATIDSATQITMTGNATSSGTSAVLFNLIDRTVDVFAYQDAGTVKLYLVIWTNDTTRATALDSTTGDTIYLSGDKTKRYLATLRTNTDSKVTVSPDVGDCLVWNYYNQVKKVFTVVDTANSWNYTSATIRQANANAANRIRVIAGLDNYSPIEVTLTAYTATGSVVGHSGIGEDVTNAFTVGQTGMEGVNTTARMPIVSTLKKNVPLGVHVYNWNESGGASCVFYGDNTTTVLQSGIIATFMA